MNPGDILVGKITPKGETQFYPEEKLLRAIFGEKAGDVRDTSLEVPPAMIGIVIDARVFSRKGTEKDERTLQIEEAERSQLEKDMADELKIVIDSAHNRVRQCLVGHKTTAKLVDDHGKELLAKGVQVTDTDLDEIAYKYWPHIELDRGQEEIERVVEQAEEQTQAVKSRFQEKIDKLGTGDELPAGVIKMVKVYVAIKRKLQVGDKMAGRHGNKGVVSRILIEEDMPYLPNGTPVDIVLNPLGVPSRMNVGQILETHFGWAGYLLGKQLQEMIENQVQSTELAQRIRDIFKDGEIVQMLDKISDEEVVTLAKTWKHGLQLATPVFDGASETEIKDLLKLAGVHENGQTVLFDGRTGDAFHEDVTVGIMYMLKLHHLVDDKIHARSIGPIRS